jgi:hypothetical protein
VRQPAWKLIHAPATDDFQLFDLGADPGERSPLAVTAGDGPALQGALEDFARAAPPPPARTGYDPALGEKLRALGYAR